IAKAATAQAIQQLEVLKKADLAEKEVQGELLVKSLETIKDLTLHLKEKANDKGHLFAGVTREMLAAEILKATRLNISPESVRLSKPLKEVGEHKVIVEATGKQAEFSVSIEAA